MKMAVAAKNVIVVDVVDVIVAKTKFASAAPNASAVLIANAHRKINAVMPASAQITAEIAARIKTARKNTRVAVKAITVTSN